MLLPFCSFSYLENSAVKIPIAILSPTLSGRHSNSHSFFSIMYLLLFVIAAISTAIANPLPADEAHREKPLTFSLNEDNPPSTYSEPAYHDDRVHNAAYGTILDKHQIPSGVTSEYPVGDMHLPLQMPKTLDPAIFNALKETESHIPKLDYMDHGSWSLGSWSPWKRPSDGAQPDSKCGESKSVCCMGSFTSSTSVVKSCNRGNLLPFRAAKFADS